MSYSFLAEPDDKNLINMQARVQFFFLQEGAMDRRGGVGYRWKVKCQMG